MVPRHSIQDKFSEVRKKFCFYLDIQDNEVAGTLSKRIEDLGLVQEVFLTERVSHVVRDRESPAPAPAPAPAHPPRWPRAREGGAGARSRADAMLQRVHTRTHSSSPAATTTSASAYLTITVQKAIVILDKIYDTFFSAPARRIATRIFKEPYIKIEFLDKLCRPVFKELEVWPEISLEPEPARVKKTSADNPLDDAHVAGAKMTRKSRPRVKEREREEKEKEAQAQGGYCEMCNAEYADAAQHRRSPHHLAFVRDQSNFLALDSLIASGTHVAGFLDKAAPAPAPLNGERRSLRIMCNGEPDQPQHRPRRSNRSQSPADLDDERAHNTRCGKRAADDRHQYYKVVGVSTKLRSSGGFAAPRRDSPPPVCNGAEPLVVKFRRVRRSELSVLSDEAEQFMFPKRASSASSSSDEEAEAAGAGKPSPQPRAEPPLALERRRLARPLALKEDSSSEDGWPEDKRKRRRRGPGAPRRGRPPAVKITKAASPQPDPEPPAPIEPEPPAEVGAPVESEAVPLPPPEQPAERCLKWEDGKLKYTAAVEQLEFAFERVPASEPWFDTFKRQDDRKTTARNVPHYFALYSRAPKLPYELGTLPPLKPDCCALSDMVKRDERPGPARSYGTRGNKRQKVHKRTAAALLALDAHPRKSPREHASTLAILGSAGLLQRRRRVGDDAKSTASEDTLSETHSATKMEAAASAARQLSERLQQFFSEVFDDAAEYDVSEGAMDGEPTITTSTGLTDVLHLVSEADDCDIIRDEIRSDAVARTSARRGHKFKKKNRTGWPNKKKAARKESAADDGDAKPDERPDRSSADCGDESTQDESSEADEPPYSSCAESTLPGAELEDTLTGTMKIDAEASEEVKTEPDDKSFRLDVKVLLRSEDKPKTEQRPEPEPEPDDKAGSRSSLSEGDDREREERRPGRGKRRSAANGVAYRLMQPVVRVARVDQNAARKLRSSAGAGRSRANRLR